MVTIDNSGCGSSRLLFNSLANCGKTVEDFCFQNQEKCVLICIKNSVKIFTIFQKMVEYSLNPPPYFVTTYCVTLIVVDVVSCLPVQCTF